MLEQKGDARRPGAGEGEGESGDHADDHPLAGTNGVGQIPQLPDHLGRAVGDLRDPSDYRRKGQRSNTVHDADPCIFRTIRLAAAAASSRWRSTWRSVASFRWAARPAERKRRCRTRVANRPAHPLRPRGASRLAQLIARLRAFGRRHRALIAVVGSLATAAVLAFLLAGRRHEFEDAISATPVSVLAATVLLQVIGLLARGEGHLDDRGGRWDRRAPRPLSRLEHAGRRQRDQHTLGVAARIAALRRSSPDVSPQVPTLIAAEPILAVEDAGRAGLFTLIAPLGLPWWVPVICLAVVGAAQRRPAATRRTEEVASCGAASRCSAGWATEAA